MTQTFQPDYNKQTLSTLSHVSGAIQMVPLDQLVPSPDNVRRTGKDEGIQDLAESIKTVGLRQNLNVRENEHGQYEVVSGGRRLKALKVLADAGDIPQNLAIPCRLLADGENVDDVSLTENEMRAPMHPADQFEAFKKLADGGMSTEEIAARYGILPLVVTRRLKLAAVSPLIMSNYRAGNIKLDAVTAFTLCDDHFQQETVYNRLAERDDLNAYDIRREITAGMTSTNRDKMASFVGLEAYEAAGGAVVRDLFSDSNEGFLADADLLKRLFDEKVQETVSALEDEGFSWVKYWAEWSYDDFYKLTPIRPETDTDDEEGEETEPAPLTEEEKAASGAIVYIRHNGELDIRRGLVERKKAAKGSATEPSGPVPEFSGPMTQTLTIHRTAALRVAMVDRPDIALRELALNLAGKLMMKGNAWQVPSCLSNEPKHYELDAFSPEECKAHALMAEGLARWKEKLPEKVEDLWEWLLKQDDQTVTNLIVTATALTCHDVGTDVSHMKRGNRLAKALGLDMADWWAPSLEGFISRMKKAEMVRAVKEVGMAEEADRILTMKKAEAAAATARALDGTRWLPKTLKMEETGA